MRPELSQAIDLLRSDSPGSIERAIELLQNTVYSFSMKVCGHREDAEDTMQEVAPCAIWPASMSRGRWRYGFTR